MKPDNNLDQTSNNNSNDISPDSSFNSQIEPIPITTPQPQPQPSTTIEPMEYSQFKKPKRIWLILVLIALILVAGGVITVLALNKKHQDLEIINPDGSKPDSTKNKPVGEGQEYLAEANNAFAFDLYSTIDTDNSNLFFSPYSISSALAMVYEGAKEKTAEEIKKVFYFPEISKLRAGYKQIYEDINKANKDYELNTGNAIWPDNDFAIKPAYISTIKNNYGGQATVLDYSNPIESANAIDSYIRQQTKDKIKDLVTPDAINSATKLILTNAIYFKADWLNQFKKEDTFEKGGFKLDDNKTIKTPMMNDYNVDNLKYLETDTMQLLELPYKGNEISMLIMLPKNGLDSIKGSLNLSQYKKLISKMEAEDINKLTLPKFKFESDYELNQTLVKLGMPLVFSQNQANLTNIFTPKDQENLYVSLIKHKAFIEVDELGTEAAAATAVTMDMTTSIDPEPKKEINFIADHPFIFMIKNNENNNILFIGKVLDPSKMLEPINYSRVYAKDSL